MARRTLTEIEAAPAMVDEAKLAATTEDDIRRHITEDGEYPETKAADWALIAPPRAVRQKLGMTQEEFARALRVPTAMLRDWEQGRLPLDPAVKSLLAIVYRMPEALKALAA